jgi:hypothetical protein
MGLIALCRALGPRRGWRAWRMLRALRVRESENEQALAAASAAGLVMPTDNEIPLNRRQRRALARRRP